MPYAAKMRRRWNAPKRPFVSEAALANMGDGKVGYVAKMSVKKAKALFPNTDGLPTKGNIYCLYSASGYAIVLTNDRNAAVGHAIAAKLAISSVH